MKIVERILGIKSARWTTVVSLLSAMAESSADAAVVRIEMLNGTEKLLFACPGEVYASSSMAAKSHHSKSHRACAALNRIRISQDILETSYYYMKTANRLQYPYPASAIRPSM